MRKMRTRFASIFFVICMLLSACGTTASPEKTIAKLESALHRADFEAVLECFEPHVGQGIRAVAKLTGGLIGIDGEAVLELLPLVVDVIAMTDDAGDYDEIERQFKSIQLYVTKVTYNDDGDEATAWLNATIDGKTESGSMKLVLKNGEWYIKAT